MAAKLTQDMEEFLSTLNQRETRYLVVGGHAVNAYTEPRTTKDLDVWIEPTAENAKRAVAAMKDFGAPEFTHDEKAMADKDTFFIIGHRDGPNRIDILKDIPGVEFAACWENRRTQVLDSVTFAIPSPTDLHAAKLAAGRYQDLADAQKLQVAIELEQKQKAEPQSVEQELKASSQEFRELCDKIWGREPEAAPEPEKEPEAKPTPKKERDWGHEW